MRPEYTGLDGYDASVGFAYSTRALLVSSAVDSSFLAYPPCCLCDLISPKKQGSQAQPRTCHCTMAPDYSNWFSNMLFIVYKARSFEIPVEIFTVTWILLRSKYGFLCSLPTARSLFYILNIPEVTGAFFHLLYLSHLVILNC